MDSFLMSTQNTFCINWEQVIQKGCKFCTREEMFLCVIQTTGKFVYMLYLTKQILVF